MPGKNTTVSQNIFSQSSDQEEAKPSSNQIEIPSISLPKGGGAIKSIDDKFQVNAANGTAGFSIPFPFSPSRNAFTPQITLSYNSGSGNGTFGLGWSAGQAFISRKTDRQLPLYHDADESDTFIFSGAEDMVPVYIQDGTGNWIKDTQLLNGAGITTYRPRIEGSFSRIEKITEASGNTYWQVTTRDNVVSIFGKSSLAQIYHPADASKIFKWLPEFSYDDKGNCLQYQYKKEDKVNMPAFQHEKNRLNGSAAYSNSYLKSVRYGNQLHFNRASIDLVNWVNFLDTIDYLLELVLDYGEHNQNNPQPTDDLGWAYRSDAFSDYRSGFEIRTCRTCSRLLMFHHFNELGTQPCLVRSLDFSYNAGSAFTFLSTITQKGYIRQTDGSYSQKLFPPLEFTYQQLGWNTDIKSLPAESLENLPVGIDNTSYQWMDLYGEGISGILTEQAGGWYYKRNAGNGQFDGLQLVSPKPSLDGLSIGTVHFQDIMANGHLNLVSNDLRGYYEYTPDEEWLPFRNFKQVPNVDLHDPNLKLLDLNGDGKADILISEDDIFVWYASVGTDGYCAPQTIRKSFDEEKGPNIVFADTTQSIVLADMSGDGLMDIVRIRNRDIVYWPNLGYGKFGCKVSMSNAPVFDHQEHFNPNYIKLADLDGSGTTDIVYLGQNSFKVYFNQCGNSWSAQNLINGINPIPFLKINPYTTVSVIDLLGTGTGCIVWSSPLPGNAVSQLYYIDLMGGQKPHIMIAYKNNMGKEAAIQYQPSTFFYLADKKAGNPWITKLPFPVQCVSKVEVTDQVRKSRFINQYTYHHGCYDYDEREFRGFGRVEQTDTENYDRYINLQGNDSSAGPNGTVVIMNDVFQEPPVLTKTWYHTGAFLNNEKILDQFAHEYYQNNLVPEQILAEPPQPPGLSVEEYRQALRACKGMPLHVEVYATDGSAVQDLPYTTAQHNCLIQLLQPKLNNLYAVFTVLESEALTYTYERNPADPRIAHSMNIEVDKFGNVLQAAAISYGRKAADNNLTATEQAEQSQLHIIFSVNSFSNTIDTETDYHLPVSYQSQTFELTGAVPATGNYFSVDEVKNDFAAAALIPYQSLPTVGLTEKRLIEQLNTLFLKNDLSGPLDTGLVESMVLPYQSYKLALTTDMAGIIFGDKVSDAMLINEGAYHHLNDANYWIISGTQTLDANNFYQVIEVIDPFGYTAQISYDAGYHFYIRQTTDMLQNQNQVIGFNFRTLSPYLMQDSNDNQGGVRLDEVGMVMQTFVMGKQSGKQGDYMDPATVEASANDQPATILEYNLLNYLNTGIPNYIKTTARETDYYESLAIGKPVVWQTAYTYVDGGGQIMMQKVQAEPGFALQEDGNGNYSEVDTSPNLRWVGNGRTILNNKGKPVMQYEPYFSVNFDFEDASQLVERGVTPVIYYDSIGRVIKTELPNGTFSMVEFDAWKQRSFDANDTVLQSQWYADRITNPVTGTATPEEIAAANKAAVHADTPTVSYLDSLGRNFLAIGDNGAAGKYKTRTDADIQGNTRSITDARGNTVMQYKYDMLGNLLYQLSMDAGERWMIRDVMGKPIYNWDSRDHTFRYEYDVLHRPVKSFVKTGSSTEINNEQIIYGEGIANDKQLNLRGKAYQHFDSAGMATNIACDFKGNTLQASRQLCQEYKLDIDWNSNPLLQAEVFTTTTVFDALNRPVTLTSPDKSIITPGYNAANLLNTMEVQLKGAAQSTSFVKNITHDAKGQRQSIGYGNNTKTNYQYDSKTFRLTQLLTTGNNGTSLLQQLNYTYDPVGNISHIDDEAQQTIFFNNSVVDPSADYVYNAIYQLITATGREHIGQNQPPSAFDTTRTNQPQPGDGAAMRNYTQNYVYDAAGNILQMSHAAGAGSWTRNYTYDATDNRLTSDAIGSNTENFTYDAHGNMLALAQLQGMTWNYKDELQQANLGGGGNAYYVYDAGGQRVRKIIERPGGVVEERIYLGGFEIYRLTDSTGTLQETTETLNVMDDAQRIALVETKTVKAGVVAAEQLIRYQYSNHLGSAALELDDAANIISYEEYYPYGSTAYQAINAAITTAAKRYRYTGMERDDETGLEYHSARYYLPWLGRWLSADPIGVKGGMNVYEYCGGKPITFKDDSGNTPQTDGTDAHKDILPVLVKRYNAYFKLQGSSTRAGSNDDSSNYKTLPGGSKTGNKAGEPDLSFQEELVQKWVIHTYELKPQGTSDRKEYIEQLKSYFTHERRQFRGKERDSRLKKPVEAKAGTILNDENSLGALLLVPIKVDKGEFERIYTVGLARDKDSHILDGFIEYSFFDVPKKPEEKKGFVTVRKSRQKETQKDVEESSSSISIRIITAILTIGGTRAFAQAAKVAAEEVAMKAAAMAAAQATAAKLAAEAAARAEASEAMLSQAPSFVEIMASRLSSFLIVPDFILNPDDPPEMRGPM